MSIPEGKSKLKVCVALQTLFVFFMLSTNSFCQDTRSMNEQQSFAGSWWQNASADERTGFLYALDDCLTFDRKPGLLFDDTWITYGKKISSYYLTSSTQLTTPVQSVFEHFGKREGSRKILESKTRYGDEFWRSHNEFARRGFIEGFISCRVKEPNSPKWSKPIDYYLQSLDDLYNADDRHGEDAPEYAGSAASALMKNRDR
jgi:hypothetical protein